MKSITASAQALSWTQALALRIRTLWIAKMVGTTLGIYGFFLLYFWVLHSTAGRAYVVPMTVVDHWVGIHQDALLPYVSLWLYVSLAPAIAADADGLRRYTIGAAAMAALGLLIYWLFPTTTPAFGVHWSDYPALQMLKDADRGGNAFPSLHVAFAAHSGMVIAGELLAVSAPAWVRGANWLWCAAIIYSTLAIRQHVFIDVVGGLALAAIGLLACRSRALADLLALRPKAR